MSAETPRRTKIVATLGPASSSPEILLAMAGAGMDAARLNFSHGSHEGHAGQLGRATCTVLAGGLVETHKGVNVPGVPVPIPALTRKDVDDLDFVLDLGVDYVALSFVRSPADVRDLRALIEAAGSEARVIAKIEKSEAVDSLDAILR